MYSRLRRIEGWFRSVLGSGKYCRGQLGLVYRLLFALEGPPSRLRLGSFR